MKREEQEEEKEYKEDEESVKSGNNGQKWLEMTSFSSKLPYTIATVKVISVQRGLGQRPFLI